MDITWHGEGALKINGKSASIVFNPKKEVSGIDLILLSDPNAEETNGSPDKTPKVFAWPGEYEVKDVPVTAFMAKGKGGETTIFTIVVDGIRVCHLGGLCENLSSEMISKIGDTDILIVDIGENGALSEKNLTEILESIEPRAVLPLGENKNVNQLKALGGDTAEESEKFSIKSAGDLPEDRRVCIMLKAI